MYVKKIGYTFLTKSITDFFPEYNLPYSILKLIESKGYDSRLSRIVTSKAHALSAFSNWLL